MTEETKPQDSPPVASPMPDPSMAAKPVDAAPEVPPEHEHGEYDEIDDENDEPDFDAEHQDEEPA